MTETTAFASRQEQPAAVAFDDDMRRASSAEVLSRLSQSRIAIERVWPEIDGGRFAVKRAVGDVLTVEADIYCDGHDKIAAALLVRREGEAYWQEARMRLVGNDRWCGDLPIRDNGRYYYTIIAWRDQFSSWREEISKKHSAGLPVELELEEGRLVIERVLQSDQRCDPDDREALRSLLKRCSDDTDGASKLEWLTAARPAT